MPLLAPVIATTAWRSSMTALLQTPLAFALDFPGALYFVEANVRVIVHGLWRCQQKQHGFFSNGFLYSLNQFFAYAAFLIGFIHRQIRKIAAKTKIGECAGNADEL